jgi:hypothetical protein
MEKDLLPGGAAKLLQGHGGAAKYMLLGASPARQQVAEREGQAAAFRGSGSRAAHSSGFCRGGTACCTTERTRERVKLREN